MQIVGAWENEGIEPGFYFQLCCGELKLFYILPGYFFFSPEIVFAKYLQYFLFAVSIQQSSQDYLENGHRVFQQGDNLKRLVCTKGYEMSTFIQIKLLPKTKFYTLFPN